MAITYPRSIPSAMKFQSVTFRPNSVVGIAKSPFTGQEQVHAHQGQWWTADLSVSPLEASDARAITAWMTSMNGREKTFLLGDPAGGTARGSASTTPGTPLVDGASQALGSALVCKGGPLTATGYLLEGDYIQLGSGDTANLHMVLEDVNTDGAGDFTLNLWPNLRSSPADEAAIVVSSPVGRFRMASNQLPWDETTVLYGFSFQAVEAL